MIEAELLTTPMIREFCRLIDASEEIGFRGGNLNYRFRGTADEWETLEGIERRGLVSLDADAKTFAFTPAGDRLYTASYRDWPGRFAE